MFKKLAVLFVIILSFTACSSESPKTTPDTKSGEVKVSASPEPADGEVVIEGEWATEDKEMEAAFVAEVTGDSIVVYWSDPNNTKNDIYWAGSFPDSASDEMISKADKEAMSGSLIAVDDAVKVFGYEDDYLTFEFTIADITQTIHLARL